MVELLSVVLCCQQLLLLWLIWSEEEQNALQLQMLVNEKPDCKEKVKVENSFKLKRKHCKLEVNIVSLNLEKKAY